jgi:hypothetical protein
VLPANPTDAHRRLGPQHDLAAILSVVETRVVANDYTIQLQGKRYQIARQDVRTGLRGGVVHVETRLDGTMAVRFGQRYLSVAECPPSPPKPPQATSIPRQRSQRQAKPTEYARQTNNALFRGKKLPTWRAAAIDRTRTPDRLD